MSDFVVASQSFEEQAVNVASDLPEIDLSRSFKSGLSSTIAPGTLLKRTNAQPGLNVATVSGADASGSAQTITVTGIEADDHLRSVLRAVGGGTDVTDIEDVTNEFSVTADEEITQGSTNYSSDTLIVLWSTAAHGVGQYEPWIQGTDPISEIAGVYVGVEDLDTSKRDAAIVRRFGPVRESALIAWTAANGSSTADPNDQAKAALSELLVMPM